MKLNFEICLHVINIKIELNCLIIPIVYYAKTFNINMYKVRTFTTYVIVKNTYKNDDSKWNLARGLYV